MTKNLKKNIFFISDNVDAVPLNLFERNLISTIQKKNFQHLVCQKFDQK